jgi:hypothetical protein
MRYLLVLIGLTVMLSSCADTGYQNQKSPFGGSNQPKAMSINPKSYRPYSLTPWSPTHLIIAIDVSSDKEIRTANLTLDGIRRNVERFDTLSLDKLSKDSVEVHFSSKPKRAALDEFMKNQVTKTPCSVKAIAASLKRLDDYGRTLASGSRLVGVIVTEGTNDSDSIRELQRIAKTIPASVSINFIGVSPENRNAFSAVVQPIRNRAQVSGQSTSEVISLLDRLLEVR